VWPGGRNGDEGGVWEDEWCGFGDEWMIFVNRLLGFVDERKWKGLNKWI
jgi:hypothetical protein